METEGVFVGIDVAKAQLDVAARSTDDRWTVSTDEAGIGQLASRLKALEPTLVLLLRLRADWNCPRSLHWRLRRSRGGRQPSPRA